MKDFKELLKKLESYEKSNSNYQKMTKICPKCSSEYFKRSAISRADNKTEICKKCSNYEVMFEYLVMRGLRTLSLKKRVMEIIKILDSVLLSTKHNLTKKHILRLKKTLFQKIESIENIKLYFKKRK